MKAWRRFKTHTPPFADVKRMDRDHPAVLAGRTVYRARVRAPSSTTALFKDGSNNRKIGRYVVKGRWKGMPIYTLTLEERATCPNACARWRDCFGNKMNWSVRWEAGAMLEARIKEDVARLAFLHPDGFVVRLHVLGDFYSAAYVRLWAGLLDKYPALRVYGYTARDPWKDEIGVMLGAMAVARWDRFAMRFSGRALKARSAVTLDAPRAVAPAEGIVCPAQTGRVGCCGECGLCWQTTKNIFFLLH